MWGYGPHCMYCKVSWSNHPMDSAQRELGEVFTGAVGGRPLAAQHGHTGNAGAASLFHTTNYGEIVLSLPFKSTQKSTAGSRGRGVDVLP